MGASSAGAHHVKNVNVSGDGTFNAYGGGQKWSYQGEGKTVKVIGSVAETNR